jgi:hypothetical protein
MANNDMVLLRKTDGSGSGYLFDPKDAKRFMAEHPGEYVEEGAEQTEANQARADEEAAADDAATPARTVKAGAR